MSDVTQTPNEISPAPSESVTIYPFLRKLFFAFIIIALIAVAVFLIYQNGKSIYDNGI